ncbi:MAG: hypothetical protein XD94_1257 [Mesotoga prima]|uniref:Uncharacterized protein n=1 Tax=Mesotoga prima TaxID=1184387 RepID=A0A101HNL5_9BACT|nr:MAG: hypothetical protein XD94_1257 [Mesotoga prima]
MSAGEDLSSLEQIMEDSSEQSTQEYSWMKKRFRTNSE